MRNEGGGQPVIVDPVVVDKVSGVLHGIGGEVKQVSEPVSADTVSAAAALQGWASGGVLAALATSHEASLDMHARNLGGLAAMLKMAASDYRAADAANATTMRVRP